MKKEGPNSPQTVQNENVLMNRPHTNSSGYWSFRHMTKRRPGEYLVVDQYWIDLTKYKPINPGVDYYLKIALDRLKDHVK